MKGNNKDNILLNKSVKLKKKNDLVISDNVQIDE